MFQNKSSTCSFTFCAIFESLIIFRHSVTKTQILIKVSLCIFHDANHYKNNQNDQKQVNWNHLNINLILMVIFFIFDGYFPMSQHNENTDIEHGLKCLWHDPYDS